MLNTFTSNTISRVQSRSITMKTFFYRFFFVPSQFSWKKITGVLMLNSGDLIVSESPVKSEFPPVAGGELLESELPQN